MRNRQISKFGAIVVDKATQSMIYFSGEIEQTEMLIFFLLVGDDYISENKERARATLIDIYDDPENKVSSDLVKFFRTEEADVLFDMMFYERHFSQMAFSRSIDNLITYFKDILAEVVLKTPQVLKSKDQERLDFILNHDSMEGLLKSISEKKIEELFYKGIADIEKFFIDRLGIKIFKDDEVKRKVNRLIKQRNLIVHNRGKISREFVREFPESGYKEGQYLSFDYEGISYTNLYLSNFVVELDTEISDKFELSLFDVK